MAEEFIKIKVLKTEYIKGDTKISYESPVVNTVVNFIKKHPIPPQLLNKEIQKGLIEIKRKSLEFYLYIEKEMQRLNNLQKNNLEFIGIFRKLESGQLEYLNKGLYEFPKRMNENKLFEQFLYDVTIKAQQYSNYIRSFLGARPIDMIYGKSSGNIEKGTFSADTIALFHVGLEDVLKIEGKSSGKWKTRISASIKELRSLATQHPTRVYQITKDQDLSGLNKTVDEMVRRYQKYKPIILWTWGYGKRSGDTRTWKKFHGEYFNTGHIIEAYSRCIYERSFQLALRGIVNLNDTKTEPYELSANAFMESLDRNDHISGMLVDDIENFAIKANRAQAMGLKPILQVAYDIMTLKSDSYKDVKQIVMSNLDRQIKRGQISSHLSEAVYDSLDSALSSRII